MYGADYLPDEPRSYAKKVKGAQEAHEAIRPAGEAFRSARRQWRASSSGDEAKLYELIWKRTIASQMKDARGEIGVGPNRWHRPQTAATPCSAPPAR